MIKFYDEFLKPDDFFYAKELSNYLYFSGECVLKTNASWSPKVLGNSFPIMSHVIGDEKMLEILRKRIDTEFGPDIKFTAQFYYYTQFSYIPWHDDVVYDGAMTIYMTDTDYDDGGYFMYEDGDEIKAIRPMMNMAIYNKDVHHCVTSMIQAQRLRQTIQIFFKKTEKNA